MVEQNKPEGAPPQTRDVWKEQRDKAGKKRKHKGAFGKNRINWAEKRENKRQRQDQRQTGTQNYEIHTYTIGSDRFNEYYKKVFADIMPDEAEFQTFLQILQDKLPVTFRLNSGEPNFQHVSSIFKDPNFIKQFIEREGEDDEEDKEAPEEDRKGEAVNMDQNVLVQQSMKEVPVDFSKLRMDLKPFYPHDVLFEMMIPRQILKKNAGLKKIHKFVMQLADSGLITRQEIVSMIPPILLDVKADHAILDMCAAPGSKTAQLLELIQADQMLTKGVSNETQPSGFVIANDADYKRAFMLTHQMNRLNQANIAVTNHEAQVFPELRFKDCKPGEDRRVRYDRIVCDVPCSSDAAIRKIPTKWKDWSTRDGQSLHALQIQILERGIQLLKVGGKITYSTCSLNPIENESVVAATLKKFKGKIRLLEAQDMLKGFRFQQGVTSWPFMQMKSRKECEKIDEQRKQEGADSKLTYFDCFESMADVPQEHRSHLRQTMFCNHYDAEILSQLPSCLRVMPHHQNTSGFFITVIEKVAELEGDEPDLETEDKSEVAAPVIIQKDARMKDFNFLRCDINDPDVEYIQAYYGLQKGAFPTGQLITQDPAKMSKVHFISKSLSRLLHADSNPHNLKIINIGCNVFVRNKGKNSANVECIYRVCQDGIRFLLPWLKNRILYTSCTETFKRFITHRQHEYDTDIPDKELVEQIRQMSVGCFIVIYRTQDGVGNVEPLTMHNFGNDKVSSMISKENLFSLQMRYLDSSQKLLYGHQVIKGNTKELDNLY